MTIEVPKYEQLMLPIVRALEALGGSGSREEIRDRVPSDLKLPPAVIDARAPNNSGSSTILEMRISWALSYLKAGRALGNSDRGVWTVLERGRSLSDSDVPNIVREYKIASAERRREREAAALPDAPGDNETPVDNEVSPDWKSELLKVLREMPPDGFERLCQRVLRESNFQKVEVTGKSGDGGIDGHGQLEIGLISFHVVFQAKRWKGSVGSSVVRDFRGAMSGRADKGLIITTGTFTADARKEATRDSARPIDLYDGERLCQLLQRLRLGVIVEMVEKTTIHEEFFKDV